MEKFLTLFFFALAATSLTLTSACTFQVTNNLVGTPSSAIMLCGRKDGDTPGDWYKKFLLPGESYSRACASTASHDSFSTYISPRNATSCPPWTGKSGTAAYAWYIGEGLTSSVPHFGQLWYGSIQETPAGSLPACLKGKTDYNVQLSCMSYGQKPYSATCGCKEPRCTPSGPGARPNTGVVACGKDAKGNFTISVSIDEL